ncbi:MAG TPA: LON peptidase substrate-binding domain-containing protein, partial [Terriglobales bacterium]|nr:LON peptidase substrate-binding domain-containing protein [Terriglobales bacterium]
MEQPAINETTPTAQATKSGVPIPAGALAILPLRNTVLFPNTVMPLTIGRPSSLMAVEDAVRKQLPIGIVAQQDSTIETPQIKDLYEIGVTAEILRMSPARDGQRQVIVQGRQRFKLIELLQSEPFLVARMLLLEENLPQTKEFEARVLHLREQATKALSLLPQPSAELKSMIESIQYPAALIDIIASTLDVPLPQKQKILATLDVEARLHKVSEELTRQVELLELRQKIRAETKESVDKAQREYFLREQVKAIKKELGEEEGQNVEIEELRSKVEALKAPPEVEKEALRELSRLERMPEMSAEHSVIRTFLDWIVDLPWNVVSEERIDLPKAREILDVDHHDLEKVKKRIIEFLAVRKLNPLGKSPILCFVGPPGVGKTSLGQSIARAMNRKFVRQSLGGVHDEAEIRGHRRTYIGALPGRIIQGIRKA